MSLWCFGGVLSSLLSVASRIRSVSFGLRSSSIFGVFAMTDNPTFRLSGYHFEFTPLGGPLDQQPLAPLFQEIGHAIQACARLELLVTCLVIHVNKEQASQALYDPDPQGKYVGTLKLLRDWLTQHPEYAKFKSDSDDKFYGALIEEANLRHELVHSFLQSIDPTTGDFVMARMRRVGKDEWQPSTTTYKAETARYVSAHATNAALFFTEVAKQVFKQVSDEQPQTP